MIDQRAAKPAVLIAIVDSRPASVTMDQKDFLYDVVVSGFRNNVANAISRRLTPSKLIPLAYWNPGGVVLWGKYVTLR